MTAADAVDQCLVVEGADLLTSDGWRKEAFLVIRDGRIEDIQPAAPNCIGRRVDARGLWVLPGIIDLHGDAFERHISPRPGVRLPIDIAIEANDTSLVNAGITTFYYSITDGFEPGLRSRDMVRDILRHIEEKAERLLCGSRIHLRHEQANIEGHGELLDWLAKGRVHLLSLNNHLPKPDDSKGLQRYLNGTARRLTMSETEAGNFANGLIDRLPLGVTQLADLAKAACAARIPLASHDDATAEDVTRARGFGVNIAEFPMNFDSARALREAGIHILMGAPNAVRGNSHVSGISVREAVAEGTVDVLCSDYHYPSLLRAPFLFNELGLLDFIDAWALVSRNPAASVGLATQKGSLAVGLDADFILITPNQGQPLDVVATFVGGKAVMSRRWHQPRSCRPVRADGRSEQRRGPTRFEQRRRGTASRP